MNRSDARFIQAQLNTWAMRFRKARDSQDPVAEVHAANMMDLRFQELRQICLTPQGPCDHNAASSKTGDKNG